MVAGGAGGDALCGLPAQVLAGRIRAGEVSATEALEAHLARIARRNPALNAVVSLDVAAARAAARAADARRRAGERLGPLHGVPMTLKDGHDVAGLRTTVGLAAMDRVADEDGTVAARLRAAGAIVFGHSNVAAGLGDFLQTENPLFGRTNNPWDTGRTAGGSSGGAAAAVAAGLTPLEVGSDLAGSVRAPAHFCGVYGLKTTEHRVSLDGFFRPPAGAPRPVRIMSCPGPLARDLGGLRLALDVLAGPDGRDGDVPPVPLAAAAPLPLAGLRLALTPALPGAPVARDVRRRMERVAAGAAAAGARVLERLPEVDWAAQDGLFVELVTAITGVLDPDSDLRPEQRTLAWYLDALDRRDRSGAIWAAFFEEVDALLLPTALGGAFTHRPTGSPVTLDGAPVSYWAFGRTLAFANLLGLPALSVPAGAGEDGLPLGLQIVGPRWSETRLLAIAGALEDAEVLPGFAPPPG